MKEFLLVFRGPLTGDFTPTSEQIEASEKEWNNWFGTIAAQGKLGGGHRPGPEGKTLLPGNVITDGPYAEVKEILMGTTVVKTETIDEAVELAKGCPILKVGGNVEVRSLIMMG